MDTVKELKKKVVMNMNAAKEDKLLDNNPLKLERTIAFWKANFKFMLRPSVTIFSGIVDNNLISIDIVHTMRQLIRLNLIDKVISLIPMPNKAFTLIEFSDITCADKFQNASVKINDTKTIFVSQEPDSSYVNIFIDKLPAYVLKEYLPKLLSDWGEVCNITPTKMSLLNGHSCSSGSNKVKFKINSDCSIEDIPYFIKIENLKTYLHIPSRPKICFRCLSKDHLVSACFFKYCHFCRVYKDPNHLCKPTYASRLSSTVFAWQAALLKAQEECMLENLGLIQDSPIVSDVTSSKVTSTLVEIPPLSRADDVSISSAILEECLTPPVIPRDNFPCVDNNSASAFWSPLNVNHDTSVVVTSLLNPQQLVDDSVLETATTKNKRQATAGTPKSRRSKKQNICDVKIYPLRNKRGDSSLSSFAVDDSISQQSCSSDDNLVYMSDPDTS